MKKQTFLSYMKCFSKHHIFLTVFLILTMVLSSLSSLVPPLILQRLIDDVLQRGLSFQRDQGKLWIYSVLYLLSYLLIFSTASGLTHWEPN